MGTEQSDDTNPDFAHPPPLYAGEADRNRHFHHMWAIASENKWNISEVVPSYERILGHLKVHALVHDYLDIFVGKKVIESLGRHHQLE